MPAASPTCTTTTSCASRCRTPAGDLLRRQRHLRHRAPLRSDLGERWRGTIAAVHQKTEFEGAWDHEPRRVGNLENGRFGPEYGEQQYTQVGWTLEGNLGIGDIVYAGAYFERNRDVILDYSDYVEYASFGGWIQQFACDDFYWYGGNHAYWWMPGIQHDGGPGEYYEVGWKATLGDGRAIFNGAVYYMDWQDFQTSIYDLLISPLIFRRNAGSANVTGYAQVTYSYADESWNLLVTEPFQAEAIPRRQAACDLLDLRVGWTFGGGRHGVEVFGTNLLDDQADISINTSLYDERITTNRPRTLGIRLKTRFN